MKKIIGFILATIMIFTVIGFVGCGAANNEFGTGFQTYVNLSINPNIELFVNEDGIVESVNALNEDAEIILSDCSLVNMNIKDATQKFVDAATLSGYVDVNATMSNPNQVKYFVISEQASEELENTVRDTIDNYFVENGIYGLSRRDAMESLRTQAEELGVSLGKYKIITRVLEISTDYTLEELADMPIKDIVAILRGNFKKEAFGTLKDELKADMLALKQTYFRMFELRSSMETLEENIATTQSQIALLQNDLILSEDLEQQANIQNQITLAQTELTNMQTELEANRSEYNTLHSQFLIDTEALRNEYKDRFSSLKNELKLQKQALVEQHKANLNQHRRGIDNTEKDIIKNWINTSRK